MSFTTRAATFAAATFVLALVASPGAAQEPVASFDRLDTRIQVGDTVWVTDTQGRQLKGKVRVLSATSLRLEADAVLETHAAAHIRTVRTRAHDGLGNGIRWGALAGIGAGVALAAGWWPDCAGQDDCLTQPAAAVFLGLVGGAAGVGIGAAVDAVLPGPMLTIYQARGGSSARLSIAPLASRRGRGLGVTVRF